MNDAAVSGVVLTIVTPKSFAGEVLTFHFCGGPPSAGYRRFYEPGLLYSGKVARDYIGSGASRCDLALECVGLAQPLPPGTPDELRRLLQKRHWNTHYAAAIKKQCGEKILFRVLYGCLTASNDSNFEFQEQREAAKLLLSFQPACDVTALNAIRQTLPTWDEAVGEWPLYLRRSLESAKIVQALNEVEKGELSERDREKMQAWRFWLGGH